MKAGRNNMIITHALRLEKIVFELKSLFKCGTRAILMMVYTYIIITTNYQKDFLVRDPTKFHKQNPLS